MHLDLNVLRAFIGNNNAIQQRILFKFGGLINDSRRKVIDAANKGTLDVVRSACHALKSSSRSVGAIELGRLSEQLEAIAAGRAPGPIEPVLALFLEECSAVELELKEKADATGQP
jgi:HPt (histidine-containing phosphotransfer) domain-containing protein